MRIIKTLTLLCFFQTATLYAQQKQAILDSVLSLLSTNEMFHGQVLIAEKGEIHFNKAYGIHRGEPASQGTAFNIESITKGITATCVLMLVDRQMLKLDDHLQIYFPELPYPEVTLRHLLTMTSGLPRFFETALAHGDTTRTMSNPEILALIAKHKPASQPPGHKFQYNNTNYLLLASVIEKVSGLSYAGFVDKNVFTPLGMRDSYVKINEQITLPTNADNFYQPYGEGNIHSSAQDLFLLDQALKSEKLVPRGLTSLLFSPHKLIGGEISNYGFGWRIHSDGGETKVRILGDGKGSHSIWERHQQRDQVLIYIHINSTNYQEPVYKAVQDIWAGRPYSMPEKRTVYPIDTELYKDYIGSYLSPAFGLLHITEANGKLYLRPDPVPGKEELIPSSDTTFFFANQPIEWEFFKNDKGEVTGLSFKGDRASISPKQK